MDKYINDFYLFIAFQGWNICKKNPASIAGRDAFYFFSTVG